MSDFDTSKVNKANLPVNSEGFTINKLWNLAAVFIFLLGRLFWTYYWAKFLFSQLDLCHSFCILSFCIPHSPLFFSFSFFVSHPFLFLFAGSTEAAEEAVDHLWGTEDELQGAGHQKCWEQTHIKLHHIVWLNASAPCATILKVTRLSERYKQNTFKNI